MKVHHLNCGSLRSPSEPMVCHVLLVETDDGLVLVDSGFGLQDCADPARRLGVARHMVRPVLNPAETAVRQVESLGFDRNDVRDIVVTHFDLDHVGGLSDFPSARVHVTSTEARAKRDRASVKDKLRYRRPQWAHGPTIVEHDVDGESWHGFAAAKELADVSPGIVLVPMPGHTRGHACIAVDAGEHWVLHCGDAFYHRGTVDGRASVPALWHGLETILAFDRKQMRANQARLADLHRRAEPDLMIVSAHDAELYARAAAP